jgi:hypothetical protein
MESKPMVVDVKIGVKIMKWVLIAGDVQFLEP